MVANLNATVIYRGLLTLENVGTAVNYRGTFIILTPFTSFHFFLLTLIVSVILQIGYGDHSSVKAYLLTD
jgi:hypothetical protein